MAMQELVSMRKRVEQLSRMATQLKQEVVYLRSNDDPIVDNAKTWLRGAMSSLSPPQTFKFLRYMEEILALQRQRLVEVVKASHSTSLTGKPC